MGEEKGKPPSKSKTVVVKSKKGALIPSKAQPRKAKLSGKKSLSKSGLCSDSSVFNSHTLKENARLVNNLPKMKDDLEKSCILMLI